MGYRGEDASRTRADSRRQPWRSSSGTGPGDTGSWDDGALGYGQDDDYAAAGGYGGYGPGDSHPGYEGYGRGGGYGAHGAPGGYAESGDYGVTDGGVTDGYGGADGYSTTGGHRAAGRHAAQGMHGASDAYGVSDGYSASDGYGYGADGPGYANGSRYANDDAYPNGGGYAPDGGHPASDGYADSKGYADGGGYADDGYRAQYDLPAGHGQQGGYGGYRDVSYGSGSYGQQRPGQEYPAGDYPARGYGSSGGYPALGAGSTDPDADGSSDAGNDWYNAQPAAAAGSGFADTGTLDARAIGSYGTGPLTVHDPVRGFPPSPPGPRHQLNAAPQDLVHTGQQEVYDQDQYDSYAGYDQDDYDQAQGYGPTGGYQTTRGYDQYDQYDEPEAFETRGYDVDLDYDGGPSLDLAPGYDDEDPYQELYGEGGTGPRPGAADGDDRRGRKGGGKQKRSGRRVKVLLLSVAAVVVVGIGGAAAYTFILKKAPASNSALSAGPLPSTGSSSAATQACVKQLGPYCHIERRADDPEPLTLAELFPPAFLNESDHTSFTRLATKLDKTCSNAVFGPDLISALKSDKCTQVLRASYASADNTIMGTIGVVNLDSTNEAHHAGKLVGANDFVAPLSTSKGIGSKLDSGTGVVEAEYKGHYLLLIWAEFATGKAPKTAAQDHELAQFETDLVAGTANPALSERMVNGSPATPAS